MPYRLKQNESVTKGLRRIAREQIERALDVLSDETIEHAVAVHQVRKHCKKVRALLRLVKSGAGRVQRRENRVLRDLARSLSASRDAEVALRTWKRVVTVAGGDSGELVPPKSLVPTRGTAGTSLADETGDALLEARRTLVDLLDRIPAWRVEGRGFDVVGKGFATTYRHARRAMREAERSGSERAFHEWRKHVKDHWYHLRLLQGAWPRVMRSEREEARRLAELLGDEHDLTVLRERLERNGGKRRRNGTRRHEAEALDLLDRERRRLRKRARRIGHRLLGDGTNSRLERLERLWCDWRPKSKR